jgi:glycine betaine/proline transport system ATP-binding protein
MLHSGHRRTDEDIMSRLTFECRGLTKVFGEHAEHALEMADAGISRADVLAETGSTLAVHNVDLSVERGEVFVVMGLSGSGKSTLVRLLNRLIDPTRGTINIDGQDLGRVDAGELREIRNKKISMVFQHFGLFPHRTVRENAAYGLKLRGLGSRERNERATWALETVGLAERADARPSALSGGMRQRVGLARALATDADIMLMDEPFSALDPLIRRDMQDLVLKLQVELKKTIIFITHDLNEAMRLGERILILKDGKSVQLGSAPEILSTPADQYVADFVADVDRSRVLTAGDLARKPRLLARISDSPEQVLRRLGASEANGVFILDDDDRVLGVALDSTLSKTVREGRSRLEPRDLMTDFFTTTADCPLIDLVHLLGRQPVPLSILDDARRLVGVVPRAAVLEALNPVMARS